MNRIAKRRALSICFLLAAIFTVFSGRLIQLQVSLHAERVREVGDDNGTRQPIYSRRGSIVDINGEPLAQNEPTRLVFADGFLIKDYEAVASIVAPILQLPRSEVLTKIKRRYYSEAAGGEMPHHYIVLKKDVPEADAVRMKEEMAAANQTGIFYEQDSKRRYPNGSLLCHVIGFTSPDNIGQAGIEQTMDEELRGHDGYRFVERDVKNRELVLYRGQERAARNGRNVRLTIDMGLQNIIETELDAAMENFKPKMAVIVMMKPQTGEILAMGSRPAYDPNIYGSVAKEIAEDSARSPFINRAISSSYEPGSTFKIVAVSAALNEHLVGPLTEIFCENGYYRRYKLKDSHPMGTLTVENILVKSSNIGACKLAEQLGEQKFYEYIRKFGFGDRTGVKLPGEENGILSPSYSWGNISISRLAMGHEVAVTPLQITTAMSAVANGGQLMMPQIVREVFDERGQSIRVVEPQVVWRVASEETMHTMRTALTKVTEPGGTAKLAHVPGYKTAGKTGTAQVIRNGAYLNNKHRPSFVGFLPAENPAFTCLVMIDEPVTPPNEDMGGLVCGPIFSRVAEKAARYLGLPPEPELPPSSATAINARKSR